MRTDLPYCHTYTPNRFAEENTFGARHCQPWPWAHYNSPHPDGFICREIRETDGEEKFQRFDPAATGSNVLPWAEWEHYRHTGDRVRLARVFPPLAAYTRWFRLNRTWPDGSYWGTGCSAKDFVGWTGVPPVAVLLEDVFGLEPRLPTRIRWNVRLLEAHGVERYPLGADTLVDLHCGARPSAKAQPDVAVRASRPVEVEVVWSGGSKVIASST